MATDFSIITMWKTPPSSQEDHEDKRFITPSKTNKFIRLSHPVSSYLLTSKMKPIRTNISRTLDKQFTIKEQKQGAQLVRKSDMVQVTPTVGEKTRARISKQKLTLQQVVELNNVYAGDIESKVRANQKCKEKLLAKIKQIEERRSLMRCLKKRMVLADCRRRNLVVMRRYYEYLGSETEKSKSIVDNLEWELGLKREQAHSLSADLCRGLWLVACSLRLIDAKP